MRPAAVRAFSTTRHVSQQPLFVPYAPPLNEKQKKTIRRIAIRDEPNFHSGRHTDAEWAMKASRRSVAQSDLLKDTLARLREIVKRHAGDQFDVVNISIDTYAQPVHDAPFEFAIQDTSRPNGVSPEEDPSTLPMVYDASRLSEVLMQEGFTGGFWSPPWDMGNIHKSVVAEEYVPPTQRDLTIPWPQYRRPLLREFHYPARLITYSPIVCSLTLPGPSVLRLNKLLKDFFKLDRRAGTLMILLFTWLRSHRIDEFTPQCLALLVIRYLQDLQKLPHLMDPTHQTLQNGRFDHSGVERHSLWVPFQYHLPRPWGVMKGPREVRVINSQLEHQTITAESRYRRHKSASLIWDFFGFWRSGITLCRTYAHSVGQNKYIKRQYFPPRTRDKELSVFFNLMEKQAVADYRLNPYSLNYDSRCQPLSWALQSVVVPDPFVPTYNHGESVSRESIHALVRQSASSWSRLAHHWPLLSVYGPHFVTHSAKFAEKFKASNVIEGDRFRHTSAVKDDLSDSPKITNPPLPILAARAKTIRRVQTAIQRKYGREYTVQPFGSTAYGVSNATSDLDLVILDPSRPDGPSPDSQAEKQPKIYDIRERRKLSQVLRYAGFQDVVAIVHASVPIVKFKDQFSGIECDINVNARLGLLNTAMIKRYCDLVPLLRPMVAYLKCWAKPLGLNNPSSADGKPVTFSSYALMLMTISFLQSRGLAPNLQDGIADNKRSYFWLRKKQKRDEAKYTLCDTSYHLGDGWVAKEDLSLRAALTAWFQYWGVEHDYSTTVGSIRHGGFVSNSANEAAEAAPDLDVDDTPDANVSPFLERAEMGVPHPDETLNSETGSITVSSLPYVTDGSPPQFMRSSSEATPQTLGKGTNSKSPSWLEHPICIIDPFIHTKVVTRGIALPSRTLFQLECQWAMAHLHHGSPLGSVVRPTYPPTAQGSSLRKLFLPPRKPVSWTSSLVSKGPESYAGAIGRGPNARPSKSMKQLCDLLSEEAQKIVEQTEVEEDEPEGFGLKKIYFTTKGLGTGTVGGSDNVDSPETNIHIIVA